jgi:RNA polymerase sigma-70 factor (ECF subfamily)
MESDRWGGESFDTLYRESFAVVVRSVRLIVGDAEISREIAQDAFVAALVHWRKVQSYDSPAAWVRRVAVRSAVRWVKREGRRPAIAERQAEANADASLDVHAAVALLPPAQRAAVVLAYLHDLPLSEVARTMGWSQGTAKTHLFRARKTLASRLKEDND